MILIADSGSTKCHWVCLKQSEQPVYFNTIGLNPHFLSNSEILNELNKSDLLILRKSINKVFFYGAGCSLKEFKKNISNSLGEFFINAEINVEHDLIGACRSTFKINNINCIIGTGSIACFYDGKTAKPSIPSLGYIIGDEGSGNYFGKKLINRYFTGNLPEEVKNNFEKEYKLSYEDLLKNIYQNNRANSYLSSFFPFLLKHKYFEQILDEGIELFLKNHVFCINKYQDYEINFIGSVSYFLKDIIIKKSKKYNFSIGLFIKEPINELVKFHSKF
tara:strand:+ start:291 stop:1118 length:828 start_codon:yes stop_codon:yes gene_type:complete